MRTTIALLSALFIALSFGTGSACDGDATPNPVAPDVTSNTDGSSNGNGEPATHAGDLSISCDMAAISAERPMPGDDAPEEGLTLSGKVVDGSGSPIGGIKVLACTGSLCLNGDTAADGTYSFTSQVRTEKHKMQVVGFLKGYMNFNFFQDPASTPALPVDVIAPELPNSSAPLPKETGGTVEVAGGELVITAPGGIKYDIGEPNELSAVKVPVANLPPYDFDLSSCAGGPVAAYAINPLKTKLEEGTFEVTAKLGASPGAKFGIWVVDSNTAEVHKEATATADANGDVVKDPDTWLRHLDMLIFVPE